MLRLLAQNENEMKMHRNILNGTIFTMEMT